MPVPLAPYPSPPVPFTPPANGAQSQLVCSGCRNLLMYPVGATSVCCAVCNAVTAVPPPGTEMAQLVCGGCHTLLMYIRGATSVQCSCCHTINLAMEANQVAHVNCGNCRMLLMYQYGARSVKCAVCNFVTPVGMQRDEKCSYNGPFLAIHCLMQRDEKCSYNGPFLAIHCLMQRDEKCSYNGPFLAIHCLLISLHIAICTVFLTQFGENYNNAISRYTRLPGAPQSKSSMPKKVKLFAAKKRCLKLHFPALV
ncbi:hypothetical protein M9H77_00357 [Catharanthus roseus]|nr:hypothetical protein M9H77_00357 [Catharanthus roseus]